MWAWWWRYIPLGNCKSSFVYTLYFISQNLVLKLKIEKIAKNCILRFRSTHMSWSIASSFPIGYPTLLARETFSNMQPWTKPEDNPYKGIIYCRVQAPDYLKRPLLPYRTQDKQFVFPLSQRCADERIQLKPCHIMMTKAAVGSRGSLMPNSTKHCPLTIWYLKSLRSTTMSNGPVKEELPMNWLCSPATSTRSSKWS